MIASPRLSFFAAFPDGLTRKISGSNPRKGRVEGRAIEKVLERLTRKLFRDEQLARPPFKSLSAKIDFDARTREVATIHQKLAKRSLVLEAVNTKACVVVPANVNTRKVTLSREALNFRV